MRNRTSSYEIARLRRDLRVQLKHLQNLIEADLDCAIAAGAVVHTQAQLRKRLAEHDANNARAARAL